MSYMYTPKATELRAGAGHKRVNRYYLTLKTKQISRTRIRCIHMDMDAHMQCTYVLSVIGALEIP